MAGRTSHQHLSLDLRQGRTGLFFGPVPAAQLFSLAVHCARVDRQLIAHNSFIAGALSQLDASDLWRQVTTLSHCA
jgi:hypothetical protein